MEEKLIQDKILYKHNFNSYIKVKEYYNLYKTFCVVQATGTGKSYLSIQLIYDILREQNSNAKFLYVVPRNRIKGQIIDSINGLPLSKEDREKIINSIDFKTYSSLQNQDSSELEKYDMCIVDEFQHLGAEKWSKKINEMKENGIKIFGLSATPVREEYTSNPENVAETFFDGNVANYYELVDAWIDKVLPVPQYHATKVELLGKFEELKEKIENGIASDNEKAKFHAIYNKIKQKINNNHETPKNIIKENIKENGKYIYFCSTKEDLKIAQEEFLNNLTDEEKKNIEIYEVYSGYSDKINNKEHFNFYNNKTKNNEDATNKLRVMFSIDMYTEGVHIPDLDGVIMGRSTKSNRVFSQQIGRALAVKTDKTAKPLIIDLAGNIYEMRNLLRKLKGRLKERISLGETKLKDEELDLEYILTEEELDVLELFDTMKEYVSNILNLDMQQKIIEFIKKVEEIGYIAPASGDKIQSTEHINNIGMFWQCYKQKIYEMITTSEELQKEYPKAYEAIKNKYENSIEKKELGFDGIILEFLKTVEEIGYIAPGRGDKIQSTEHINNIGTFWQKYKQKIYEMITTSEELQKEYPRAYTKVKTRYEEYIVKNSNDVSMEEKIIEFLKNVEEIGYIAPSKGDKIQSTEHINNIGKFWQINKQKIYEMITTTEELQKEYPRAYAEIKTRYEEFIVKSGNDVSIEEKIIEFLKNVEEIGFIAPCSGDKIQSTEHINNIGTFWNTNKQKIYETITTTEESQKEYPRAYAEIKTRYEKSIEKKELGFDGIILEFLKNVEEIGYIASSKGDKIQSTEHINNIGMFWQSNKQKIYEMIATNEELQKDYPKSYEVIKNKYENSIEKKELGFDGKILEFLKNVEEIGYIAPKQGDKIQSTEHINNIGMFWDGNKQKIYEMITTNEELQKEYPCAYAEIVNKYKKYIVKYLVKTDKWDNKKQTDNIKYICEQSGIDYEKNIGVLKRISYKEFVAKIQYLNSFDQDIVDSNGFLNKIFDISSDVLLSNYNITLQELVENYFIIPSKIL